MIYLTPYDRETKQSTGPSQPLPCETIAEAETLMGEPSVRRQAMLLYFGPPAFCVSRCRLAIDAPSNSGQTVTD